MPLLIKICFQTLTAGEDIHYVNTENILTMTEEDIDQIQILRSTNQDYFAKLFSSRLERISLINDTAKFVPWFLECNAKRYPYWFGVKDPRNKFLYDAITKINVQ